MKKLSVYRGIVLIGLLLPIHSLYAAQVSVSEIEAVEKQAQDRQMAHKKLQAQATQLSLELAKMNQNLIEFAKQLQQDEDAVTKAETELELLEKKLKVAETEFAQEYTNLAQILASLQNLAVHPTKSLLVQPLSPVEVIRSAVLLRDSVPYLAEKATKIRTDLENITKQKQQVESKLKKLNEQKKSLTAQQQKIKKLVAEKTDLRKKIEGESVKTKHEAEKLAAQAGDLRELMEKLEHERQVKQRKQEELQRAARQREEVERKRKEEEKQQREQSGVDTSDTDENIDLIKIKPERITNNKANFAAARGKLVNPVRGSIITAYGQELSKGVNSKGIVIKSRASAQVVAPYDGSVIFSGPFKGYGNLIIIDHGQGYVSLLAGLNSADTEIGQMVFAGEPVGVMPDNDMAKLYMEIRKDQHPVNPAPWLGG